MLRGICGAFSSGIQEIRKWLRLGILPPKNKVKWLLVGGWDGQWRHQTHEHGKWGSSPRIILMQFMRKNLSTLVWAHQGWNTKLIQLWSAHKWSRCKVWDTLSGGGMIADSEHRGAITRVFFNRFKGPGWDGQWKHQKHESCMGPTNYANVVYAQLSIFVSVM